MSNSPEMKMTIKKHPFRSPWSPGQEIIVPFLIGIFALFSPAIPGPARAEGRETTVALWLFDEQIGIYPSSHLNDAGPDHFSLVLGRGGRITRGKFGNSLEPIPPPDLKITAIGEKEEFGIISGSPPVDSLTWENAVFCALFTKGEDHLRKKDFKKPTKSDLNLGAFDWTVEFWFKRTGATDQEGVVFEIGEGPRGKNDHVTRLSLAPGGGSFFLFNQPSGTALSIPTDVRSVDDKGWHHIAFVHSASENKLFHWVDGRLQAMLENVALQRLKDDEEAYFSVGRDGLWERPLPGRIDELRFSRGVLYTGDFNPPSSFSKTLAGKLAEQPLLQGPPLLFGASREGPVRIGARKHLFIDDALIDKRKNVTWTVNPPRRSDLVNLYMNGHLTVVQDEEGLIRIYGQGPRNSLAVIVSEDGIHFREPDLGHGEYHGAKNVVLRDPVGLGQVFIDPNAPPEEKWKYISGVRDDAVFIFTSPDGWSFQRNETAALPFRAGSQSNIFYDDQRQVYVAYHRSDYGLTPYGKTERRYVMTETTDLLRPWPFRPVSEATTAHVAEKLRIKADRLDPWFLDNGPLTPGGFGIEYPIIFRPDDDLDPIPTDIYIPKAVKYPWAPDTYLAFPHFYFHYHDTGVETRNVLGERERDRGSGVVEIQTMTSRDGIHWKRYPRPVYVGLRKYGQPGNFHMVRMVQGLIRRGDEIWQYHQGDPDYHSTWRKRKGPEKQRLYRLVQRLDGFISVDSAYTGGEMVTKPLVFEGNRLLLSIDTEATGYAQVGILDGKGNAIPGYRVDDCIYINGDFIETEVEWLGKGTDVSELEGRTVRLCFRMRGSKLYSMQFVHRDETETSEMTVGRAP